MQNINRRPFQPGDAFLTDDNGYVVGFELAGQANQTRKIFTNTGEGDQFAFSNDASPARKLTWGNPVGLTAYFTASLAAGVMTVTAMSQGSGPIVAGAALVVANGINAGATVTSQATNTNAQGIAGREGTYNIANNAQTVASSSQISLAGDLAVLTSDQVMFADCHNTSLDNNPFSSTYGKFLGRDDTGACQMVVYTEAGLINTYNAVTGAAGTAPVWVLTDSFTIATGARGVPRTITIATDTPLVSETALIANYAGTVTLTLPSAALYAGKIMRVRTIQAQTVVSATANVVPMIGGAAGTAILAATAGKWADMQSDGTNWQVMAGN